MQETLQKQKVEYEQKIMKEMRRKSVDEGGLCFKAQPIMSTDKFPSKTIKAVPLTEPKSPYLKTKQRTK